MRRIMILVVLVWAILYLWGLGAPDMDYTIEALRALVAQNMQDSGDWLLPHWRGRAYLAKPPLINWAILVFSLPAGEIGQFSARLPSAISVLLIALMIVFWMARQGWTKSAGYAGVLFLFLPLVFEKGTRAELEMLLTLWTTGSLLCLHEEYEARSGGKRSWPWLVGSYGLLALALLTKGPPALLFFYGTWLTWETLQRWRKVPYIKHILGLVLAIGIVGLWLGPLIHRIGWDGFTGNLKAEAFERVTNPTEVNSAPFYFYLISVLGGALPALLFFPYVEWKEQEERKQRAIRFLLCWIGSAMVLFSLVAGKESRYLLPVYPALAMLGGVGLERAVRMMRQPQRGVVFRRWIMGVGIFLLISGPALGIIPRYMGLTTAAWGWLWAGLWSGSGLLILLFTSRGQFRRVAITLLIILVAAKGFYLTTIIENRNVRKSPRAFCEQIKSVVAPGETIYLLDLQKPYINFYLRRPVIYLNRLEDLKDDPPSSNCRYLLTRDRNLEQSELQGLQDRFGSVQADRYGFGGREYFLVKLK